MPQPDQYNRSFDFTGFQQDFPSESLPAAPVDANLDAVAHSINQIIARLLLIQRDDGALANSSVGLDQLKDEVGIGVNTIANWVTGFSYVARDYVYQNNNIYRCIIAHTSGVFATDLAAAKWLLIVDFNTPMTASSASAAAAAISASNALTSETNAANSVANLSGTSGTSTLIGTGSKTFTTQAGKYFGVGTPLTIASAANPSVNYMTGIVTAYSGTSLTVNVTNFGGAGTLTDWGIKVSGTPGIKGDPGAAGPGSGDMLKADLLSGLSNYATARANMGLGSAAVAAITAYGITLINAATAAAARTLLSAASTSQTDVFSGEIDTATNRTYIYCIRLPYAITAARVTAYCASGQCDISFGSGSGGVIKALTAVTTVQTTTASLTNTSVAANDYLYVTVTNNASAKGVAFALEFTRSLS